MRRPRVSVVIPSRNGGGRLLAALAGLLAQDLGEPFEIIVVDSGSTDGTPDALARLPVRVLRVPAASFGHGRTRNLAIAESHGDLVALLVQDAVPADARWLSTLVAALDGDGGAAGAYSRQIPRPEHPAFVRRAIEGYAAGSSEPRVQSLDPAAYDALDAASRLAAVTFDNVASLVRRRAWREHPFADAPFAEDLEWSRRVLLAGHRILYVPESRVVHSHHRGALYELRRTYVCHRSLHGMFGMRLVPGLRELARAIPAAARQNLSLVRADGVRGLSRTTHAAGAIGCGVGSALGQYLGPMPSPPFRRFLSRGV